MAGSRLPLVRPNDFLVSQRRPAMARVFCPKRYLRGENGNELRVYLIDGRRFLLSDTPVVGMSPRPEEVYVARQGPAGFSASGVAAGGASASALGAAFGSGA